MYDLHHRSLETPCLPVVIDEIPDPEPPPHPQPTEPPPTAGARRAVPARDKSERGSGTAGTETREKDQAGSYARDAEQNPVPERHSRSDDDR